MTEKVKKLIEKQLATAGFTAVEDYSECKDERHGMKYLAYWRVKEITLGELRPGSSPTCAADFTVEVRMFGAKRGFFDRAQLAEQAEKFASGLIFSSTLIVKRLSCGDVCRNMQAGRLEYPLTITLGTTVKMGE